jgi:hypothetical protein
MKNRNNIQTSNLLSPEQKWAIGAGIFLGIPSGIVCGHINMFATSFKYYVKGEFILFPESLDRAAYHFQQGKPLQMLKTPYFTFPIFAAMATCAGVGFFSKKAHSTLNNPSPHATKRLR